MVERDNIRGAAGEYDIGFAGTDRCGTGPPNKSILLGEKVQELAFNSMLQGCLWSPL
jgi:hypothetical protein